MRNTTICVAGLDLAALENRKTGIAIICDNKVEYINVLYRDEEIISKIIEYSVKVVAIDAPLSHAKGYRKVDLKMKKLGFKVLPPGWRSMKLLVDRAIKLKSLLEDRGIEVIETHPLSALRSSGYSDIEQLINELGIAINIENKHLLKIKDVIDAIIAAIVAKLYLKSKTLKVSDVDGTIHLIPKIKN